MITVILHAVEALWGSREHGSILLSERPRLCSAAARCDSGSPQFISVGKGETLRGRNKADIGALSLSCSCEEDAPSLHLFYFVLSPSRRSWASCEWADAASLLDRRRCFDHDFDVQPGFPPSGRKSVNDFGWHDVSSTTIDAGRGRSSLRGADASIRGVLSHNSVRGASGVSNISFSCSRFANEANDANGDGSPELV